jgi:hypothetical protein
MCPRGCDDELSSLAKVNDLHLTDLASVVLDGVADLASPLQAREGLALRAPS